VITTIKGRLLNPFASGFARKARFLAGIEGFQPLLGKHIRRLRLGRICLPRNWLLLTCWLFLIGQLASSALPLGRSCGKRCAWNSGESPAPRAAAITITILFIIKPHNN
jgi:hypothetical protein